MALNFQRSDSLSGKGAADDGHTDPAADIGGAFAIVATLDVTGITGSTGTLDVKLQHSPDNSNWYDIAGAAFAQVAGAEGDESLELTTGAYYRYVRADYEIGAGDRAYDFSIHLEGRS